MCYEKLQEQIINAIKEMNDTKLLWLVIDFIEALKD